LLLAWCANAYAQQPLPPGLSDEGSHVHYSFATLMGTGVYSLDDRTIAVFRIPISWTFREATREQFGIKLRVPTALGLHDFDPFDSLIPTDEQFGTLSIVPGIELEYLVGENWRVKPSGYLGFGTDLSSSERSVIYGAGVSGLRPLNSTYPEMQIGTAVILSGYESNKSEGDFLTRWSAGIDAKFPTGWNVGDRNVFFGGHVIGYYYMNRVEFRTIIDEPIKLRSELEIGLFMGARPSPKIFGITIDRLGVGYRFSEVSDALIFFAGFPF
jgi:hypothetical protein